MEIRYTIPNVGPTEIRLFRPADELYEWLIEVGEASRLSSMPHVGDLISILPGFSHSRWDYSMSILYVASRVGEQAIQSSGFSIEDAEFSSELACLQCLGLLVNIGHLPGTYVVEKGVTRFLLERKIDIERVASELAVNEGMESLRVEITSAGQRAINASGYLVLNRILGLIKLTSRRFKAPAWVPRFYSRFVLNSPGRHSARLGGLRDHFDFVKRIAYLNRDTTLVPTPLTMGMLPLFAGPKGSLGGSKESILATREILGPYEHWVYERLYHSPEARKITGLRSREIFGSLSREESPERRIASWLFANALGKNTRTAKLSRQAQKWKHVATISIRGFRPLQLSLERVEHDVYKLLKKRHLPIPMVSAVRYVPPSSKHLLASEHSYIDTYCRDDPRSSQVGLLVQWVADTLDSSLQNPEIASIAFFREEFSELYADLFARLIELGLDSLVEVIPWELSKLGKLHNYTEEIPGVAFWLSDARLKDKATRTLLRAPSKAEAPLESLVHELRGLAQLCSRLRKGLVRADKPRRRHLLILASIRLERIVGAHRETREFDGGLLEIIPGSGRCQLYLLETKGRQTPLAARNELRKKLDHLDLNGRIESLRERSSYAVLALK